MASLPTKLLIDAARKAAQSRGQVLTFLHQGDPDSGQILLVCYDISARNNTILRRERDWGSDAFQWVAIQDAKRLSAEEVAAYVDRQVSRDDDLWVIEFEGSPTENPFV